MVSKRYGIPFIAALVVNLAYWGVVGDWFGHIKPPETPKKVPQFSALKLSPVPSKDDCCCEGACETQTQTLPESGNRYSWVVNGMDCAACARKVENAVKQVPGVSHVQVLFAS